VRLLVGVLAWPAHRPSGPGRPGRAVPPTFLTAADDLRFVGERADRAGGSVVCDSHGERWCVPTGFLEASA
jgi:hypothetical protein